jgi:Ca2+-binding RTX toxin-like protein
MARGRVALALVVTVSLSAACSGAPGSSPSSGARHRDSNGSSGSAMTGSTTPEDSDADWFARPECFGRRATILGSGEDDHIKGTGARDVIVTRGGNDRVSHLRDEDRLCSGSGNDMVVDAVSWEVRIDLGAGDDRIRRVAKVETLHAGAGDDRLVLPARVSVSAVLGPGDDLLRIDSDGRPPSSYNMPCLSLGGATRPTTINLLRGFARGQGHDRLVHVHCVQAGRYDDRIVGSHAEDHFNAGGGDNVIWANGGNDQITPHLHSADVLHLGSGDDVVIAGNGPDQVYGGPGDDDIQGIGGSDHLYGGAGNDRVNGTFYCDLGSSAGNGMGYPSPNWVFGGPGDDEVTGDAGDDTIDGGPGIDTGYPGPNRNPGSDVFLSVEQPSSCP